MNKSHRIKVNPGTDKNIRVQIDQDFDFLEILSLKLRHEDVYTRFCADYGVVAGRVIINGGFGVPNVNVSIFIPLSPEDESDVVISTLYPYKTVGTKNEDGYRYNLLPYKKEYGGHTPTGTFPDREDVLTRREVLEVYEKYYKFTVKTNDSGDFMIIGVPLGMQKLILDLDLSNIGTFSLRPADLIRMGLGSPEQFDGEQFKSSTDLDSLPQIVHLKTDVEVTSFWGETDICNIGISRVDFDLRDFGGINIQPHAVFLGSLFSTNDGDFLKTNCKPKFDSGNLCDLVTASGTILAIRQTINTDTNGRPILEQYVLPEGGKVIDSNGTWMFEIPMNLNYVTTNEFGEMVPSNDPNIGIPTTGKYRFRIQYQNEEGIKNNIFRADYLIPNIKEWGWDNPNTPPPSQLAPSVPNAKTYQQLYSYGFGLEWENYGDPTTTIGLDMINEAIEAKDRFYEFNFNKVYTISMFLDRWKWGFNRAQHLGIKEITNRACTTTTNRFPVNDGVRNFDFLFFLFNILITILTPSFIILIVISHVLAFLYPVLRAIANAFIWLTNTIIYGICIVVATLSAKLSRSDCKKSSITPLPAENPFKRIPVPMMSYPDCEACDCKDKGLDEAEGSAFATSLNAAVASRSNVSVLSNIGSSTSYSLMKGYIGRPTTVDTYPPANLETFVNNSWQMLLAGEQEYTTRYKVPLVRFSVIPGPLQPTPAMIEKTFIGSDVTLAQSMNLANLRSRYFTQENIIRTTISNVGSPPSDPFDDSILILFCDSATLASLGGGGGLVTFYNTDSINDPNLTGFTGSNEFNTQSITGSTPFSNTFTPTQIKYIDTNGTEQTTNSYLKITENGKAYKFKAGVEYFQVITGGTVNEYKQLTNGNAGLLNKYLFNKYQTQDTFKFTFGPPPWLNKWQPHKWKSIEFLDDYNDLEVIFLTRGVDPYTEKQTIRYDLSKLFGHPLGSNVVSVVGKYYLNVPIQKNTGSNQNNWWTSYKTPESHIITTNDNNNAALYHKPYGFSADSGLFSAFTNNSSKNYNSTDRSTLTFKSFSVDINISHHTLGSVSYDSTTMYLDKFANHPQGLYEGGSLIASKGNFQEQQNNCNSCDQLKSRSRTYSPTYLPTGTNEVSVIPLTTNINITNSQYLVFRSDRLPVSDGLEILLNNNYSLHLNNNFRLYVIDATGGSGQVIASILSGTDSNGASQNLAGDGGNGPITDKILGSLTCEKLVPIKCYQNGGTNFTINTNCPENKTGKGDKNKRIDGGCYYFVDNPLISSIKKDIEFFAEWKARFRMIFGACRGVFSEVFQNNWVNGTLYMFTFKKRTIFNITGQVKKYKFCGSKFDIYRTGQGPIIYTEGTTNSFFYRCTPYKASSNQFIGQAPKYNNSDAVSKYKGMNSNNIFYPTTIMDLGPRDRYTKEISPNPMFEGYNMDTLRTTSYNESSEILNLFIVSRLLNSSFLSRMVGAGDASINQMFSRSEDRIDGDVAQLFSVNSEYGVVGFGDDDYDDNDIYLSSTEDSVLGLFFTSSTVNRVLVSPGVVTFTPTLTNYFGYPSTQEVPFYKWKLENNSTIFGTEKNEWETSTPFYSQKYQSLSFLTSPTSDYFNSTTQNGKKGFIYNSNGNGVGSPSFPQNQSNEFLVGSPYHFYFGLVKGKSSLNRFITKYILNSDD